MQLCDQNLKRKKNNKNYTLIYLFRQQQHCNYFYGQIQQTGKNLKIKLQHTILLIVEVKHFGAAFNLRQSNAVSKIQCNVIRFFRENSYKKWNDWENRGRNEQMDLLFLMTINYLCFKWPARQSIHICILSPIHRNSDLLTHTTIEETRNH